MRLSCVDVLNEISNGLLNLTPLLFFFRLHWSIIRNGSGNCGSINNSINIIVTVLFYVQALYSIQMGKSQSLCRCWPTSSDHNFRRYVHIKSIQQQKISMQSTSKLSFIYKSKKNSESTSQKLNTIMNDFLTDLGIFMQFWISSIQDWVNKVWSKKTKTLLRRNFWIF